MNLFLLQADPVSIDWTQFGVAGGVLFLIVVFLIFLLKIVPSFSSMYEKKQNTDKEIRLAELAIRKEESEVRGKEAESRTQQANGFSQLAGALSQMSNVLHDVVIENRHTTEKLMILQRVNADTSEQVMATVNELTEEISSIRQAINKGNKDATQAKQTPTT